MMRVLQRRVRMIKVSRIQINYLDHITGVTESPRFSWVIDSPFKNCVQLGYQLQIAIDPDSRRSTWTPGWWRATNPHRWL